MLLINFKMTLILREIKDKQQLMYLYGELFGLTHKSTVKISQEIDVLLIMYQNLMKERSVLLKKRKRTNNDFGFKVEKLN
jgi:hypothetical protein